MTTPYTPEFIEEVKQLLLARRQELETELSKLHPHTEMGDDYDENAEEVSVDEVNQDLIARITDDLKKIDLALKRIEDGTYGIDASGKVIGEARLRAMPWADTAIE